MKKCRCPYWSIIREYNRLLKLIMLTRSFLTILFFGWLLPSLALANQAETADTHDEKLDIVFHITDRPKVHTLFVSLEALEGDPRVGRVKVVLQGPAVLAASRHMNYSEKFNYWVKKGVEFGVCANSMRNHEVSMRNLLPKVDFIEHGAVMEVLLQQQAGFKYIKL